MLHDQQSTQFSGPKSQVLVAEEHTIISRGLIQLINAEANLRVSQQVRDGRSALAMIEEQCFDIAVVDLPLPMDSCRGDDIVGMQFIADIKKIQPDLPVLALSMHDELIFVENALKAGASGYVVKYEAAEKIIPAINLLLEGKVYINDEMMQQLFRKITQSRSCKAEIKRFVKGFKSGLSGGTKAFRREKELLYRK